MKRIAFLISLVLSCIFAKAENTENIDISNIKCIAANKAEKAKLDYYMTIKMLENDNKTLKTNNSLSKEAEDKLRLEMSYEYQVGFQLGISMYTNPTSANLKSNCLNSEIELNQTLKQVNDFNSMF